MSLTKIVNSHTTRFGLFHSGVEVYGQEWYFCATDLGMPGVFCMPFPKHHPVHSYRTTIAMGMTTFSKQHLMAQMPTVRNKWPGINYDMFKCNCHHFTDYFCRLLGFSSGPKLGFFNPGSLIVSTHRRRSSVSAITWPWVQTDTHPSTPKSMTTEQANKGSTLRSPWVQFDPQPSTPKSAVTEQSNKGRPIHSLCLTRNKKVVSQNSFVGCVCAVPSEREHCVEFNCERCERKDMVEMEDVMDMDELTESHIGRSTLPDEPVTELNMLEIPNAESGFARLLETKLGGTVTGWQCDPSVEHL